MTLRKILFLSTAILIECIQICILRTVNVVAHIEGKKNEEKIKRKQKGNIH